jgi:hypothetical protein
MNKKLLKLLSCVYFINKLYSVIINDKYLSIFFIYEWKIFARLFFFYIYRYELIILFKKLFVNFLLSPSLFTCRFRKQKLFQIALFMVSII